VHKGSCFGNLSTIRRSSDGYLWAADNARLDSPLLERFVWGCIETGLKMEIQTNSIVIEAPMSTDLAELQPVPILPALAGAPAARSKVLARSRDRTSWIMVWECNAGRFIWNYGVDETVVVISGEVFITSDGGEERRLGQGDMAFFPAGSSCVWRVIDHVKKVAILRQDLPIPLGIGVRVWHKLLGVTGWRGGSSLTPSVRA